MAGAVNNFGPEYITRGEFQNHVETVIKPTLEALRELNKNVQNNAKETHEAIDKIELALAPFLKDNQDEKDAKRDNKLAIIAFISAVGSAIVSAAAIIFLGLH